MVKIGAFKKEKLERENGGGNGTKIDCYNLDGALTARWHKPDRDRGEGRGGEKHVE